MPSATRDIARVATIAVAVTLAMITMVLVSGPATGGVEAAPAPPVDTSGDPPDPVGEPATPPTVTSEDTDPPPTTTVPGGTDGTPGEPAVDEAPDDAENTDDTDDAESTDDDGSEDDSDGDTVFVRPPTRSSVSDTGIPVSSILLAVGVVAVIGVGAVIRARKNGVGGTHPVSDPGPRRPVAVDETFDPGSAPDSDPDPDTMQFLLELGEALMDSGDSVGHVEAMLAKVAATNGIPRLGVMALPSVLVLSVQRGDSVTTELRTGGAGALRLDQIDDILRLEQAAENGEVTVVEGRRELARIRHAPAPLPTPLVLVGYVVASVGLAMILRGALFEIGLAAALGLLVGALRIKTSSFSQAYQPFWPLIAASVSSAVVFAASRVVDDVAVFPALVAPLIFFLPGGLLTIGVLELATGQPISGSSRVASGAMQLVLLAVGIVAGARLVGIPGGDIRAGGTGVVAELAPWVGVAFFGVGVACFYGARLAAFGWILAVLYVSYAGQVVGGLFFGSSLSAFFGAVLMTPVALLAARQRSGPTPLVTFLPGFWLLVPGALGLEGVTRIIGEEGEIGFHALVTTGISMVGISLGVLLGLMLSRADPARPWAIGRSHHRTSLG